MSIYVNPIVTGVMLFTTIPIANPINGKPKLSDVRSKPSKSFFLGYKAATKEYPGRNNMSKIPRIIVIMVEFNLGVNTKAIQITVVNKTNSRSSDMKFVLATFFRFVSLYFI